MSAHWKILLPSALLLPGVLTAYATAQPPGEVLAYDNHGIYVSAPPGAAGALVVPDGAQPAVSPDGSRLAWTAPAGDGHRHVFVGAASGGAARQVTSGTTDDSQPAWAPDGNRLALARLDAQGRPHLAVVDQDGTNGRFLDTLGFAPTWSPDGRLLAFTAPYGVGAVDPNGHGESALSSQAGQASWSPDGTRIALVDGSVRLFDVGSRQQTVVLPDGASQQSTTSYFGDVAYSPAGDRLYGWHVRVENKADYTVDIERYALDGSLDPTFSPISAGRGDPNGTDRRLSVGGGTRAAPTETTPAAVADLAAAASPSRVRLSWTPPPATDTSAGFTIRYAKGSTPPATVDDGTGAGETLGSTLLVGRLEPATAYSFSVFTRDWSGASSPAATVTATLPAAVATTLTLAGPGTITYGQASALSGTLVREDTGAPIADAILTLLAHHTGEADRTLATLRTDSQGRFTTTRPTSEASRYTVRYAGSDPLVAASANTLVLVRQRITISFSPGSRVAAHRAATVTVAVAPAFPGGHVRVQQQVYEAGPNVLTRFDSRSRAVVRLDTSRRQASAHDNVVVTPGARVGYLPDPTYATFIVY